MTASPRDTDENRMTVAGAPRLPRVALAVTGAALLVVGLVLGFTVTSIGAQSTGELGLDVDIAGHRDGVLSALAQFINVGIGPPSRPSCCSSGAHSCGGAAGLRR